MKTDSYVQVIIEAEDGMYITNADESTPVTERIVASRVALGRNDDVSRYVEIDRERAEEYLRQADEENERLIEARNRELLDASGFVPEADDGQEEGGVDDGLE